MTVSQWRDVPITRQHDRKRFDCGNGDPNLYLARFARQNHESGGAKTFVAVLPDEPLHILGFYTLSPASLDYARTPELVRRGLARYEVPVFRLGRLAVDLAMQNKGLGGGLLLWAAERCMLVAEEVGGVALLIDAKDDRAAAWYEGYGVQRLSDAPLSLLLPFGTIRAALANRGT